MRYCLLASGSNGNACYVEAGAARLLIDLGIGPRVLARRLEPLDVTPAQITDLLLTHEHTDHTRGIEGLLKRQPDLVIHATAGTKARLPAAVQHHTRTLRVGRSFSVGPLRVMAARTSHDAAESACFRLEASTGTLGYATDLGLTSARIIEVLSDLDALVVESNHCPELLATGSYPAYLKRRIAGPLGHLSNAECRRLLECVMHPGLAQVTLAHLSAENNSDQAALSEALRVVDPHAVQLRLGSRSEALAPMVCGMLGPTQEGDPEVSEPVKQLDLDLTLA